MTRLVGDFKLLFALSFDALEIELFETLKSR